MGELNSTVRILGSGSYLPDTVMDNFDLYEVESIRENFDPEQARGSLSDGGDADGLEPAEIFDRWARQVTGIEERRVLPEETDLRTEDMCAEASRAALEDAGRDPEELDFIVAASVTPSDDVPNLACTLASDLGVPHVPGFTLNAACAGFVYALATAYTHVRGGQVQRVLVVSGDSLTRVTDYSDPKTAVLFSDAAGSVVVEAAQGPPGVIGRPYLTAEYAREHLYMRGQAWIPDPEPHGRLRMEGGPRVLRRAINAMADVADRALATTDLSWEDVDFVIPHQANLRITRGLERKLPLEEGKVIHTIQRYGNSSASTVPVALDELLRGERWELPDPATVVLTAVGGGYTSGGAVLEVGSGG